MFYATGRRQVTDLNILNPGNERGVIEPRAGITSGQGNQGSANTAHMSGHAGTGMRYWEVPRQLKFGTSSKMGVI